VWRVRVSWCGAPSLTKGWVCNLLVKLLLGLARAVALGSKSRRTHNHTFTVSFEAPQLGGSGPRIYVPQEQSVQVLPLGSGFPFVGSYDSQGYGEGILTRLHTGDYWTSEVKLHCDRRSVGQFVLVSDPIWSRWPDFTFLWVTITFFLLHVGRPHPYPPWTGWFSRKSKSKVKVTLV
jgi:hypothetical protein